MLNLLILCILCRTLFKSYFFNLIQLRFLFMTIFASRTNKVKSRYFHSVVEILFRLICIIPSNHSLYNAWITERPIFHQPSTPFITHIQPKKRERRQYITTHQLQTHSIPIVTFRQISNVNAYLRSSTFSVRFSSPLWIISCFSKRVLRTFSVKSTFAGNIVFIICFTTLFSQNHPTLIHTSIHTETASASFRSSE